MRQRKQELEYSVLWPNKQALHSAEKEGKMCSQDGVIDTHASLHIGTAQCFCRSGLKSSQGFTGQYIVLFGSATNPEGRRRAEMEHREDG